MDILEFLHRNNIFRRHEYLPELIGSACPADWSVIHGQTSALIWFLGKFQVNAAMVSNLKLSTDDAAENGHLDILKLLHQRYPLSEELFTPMKRLPWLICFNAATNGHLDVVHWLLDTFPDKWSIKQCPWQAYSLLFGASSMGQLKVLTYLHQRDPDLLTRIFGQSSRFLDSERQLARTDLVYMTSGTTALLPYSTSTDKWELCLKAIQNGHLPVLDWLLKTHFNLFKFQQEYLDLTMLSLSEIPVGQAFVRLSASNGHLDILQYLDTNYKDALQAIVQQNANDTANFAAYNGHLDVLKWYLGVFPQMKSSLAFPDDEGKTILFPACHLDILKHLYSITPDVGLDFGQRAPDGHSLLSHSASLGNADVLQWLLETFPDQWKTTDYSQVVQVSSSKTGSKYIQILKTLKTMHPKITIKVGDLHCKGQNILQNIGSRGSIDDLEWMFVNIAGRWELKMRLIDGKSILHLAAENGHLDFLKHLQAQHTTNVDFFLKDYKENTVWNIALNKEDTLMLEWMFLTFPKKCNLAKKNELDIKHGRNVFHMMARNGNLELIRKMHKTGKNGADSLFVQDKRCWTVSHYAADSGHVHILEWLIERFPLKWNSVKYTVEGWNIQSLAARKGRQNVLNLLEEKSHLISQANKHVKQMRLKDFKRRQETIDLRPMDVSNPTTIRYGIPPFRWSPSMH